MQIKRQPQRFSLRELVWVAFAVGLAATLVLTWGTLRYADPEFPFAEALLIMIGGGLFLAMPFVTTAWAVILTRRSTAPVMFDVIWTTPLTNQALVRAHVFAVLYRLRALVLTLCVLVPVLTLEAFRLMMVIHAQMHAYGSGAPDYWDVVGPALLALIGLIGLIGLTFLGITVGVRAGLLRLQSGMAVVSSASALMSVLVCPCVCCWFAPELVLPSAVHTNIALLAVLAAVGAYVPYLLAAGMMVSTARQWER